jgi:crotonobetainyl-CoA:carnitine CoA-transferase CaiB-like acyl-CoA transferase
MRELVGEPDRPPSRVGVSIGDSIAGLYAAFGAVMGLFRRGARGVAPPLTERIVDVALNEAVLSMMESLVPDHLAYGVHRTRTGGRMEGIAPSNSYPCADGSSVIIAGNGNGIFRRLMTVIGRPDLGEDPALASNSGRWAQRDRLDEAIGSWTARLPRPAVLAALDAAAVPAGPVNTAADIVEDEQYRARNMIQYLPVDTGDGEPREIGFPGVVPVIGDVSLPVRSLGPDLGEHTAEVLSGLLGMNEEEIMAVTSASGARS